MIFLPSLSNQFIFFFKQTSFFYFDERDTIQRKLLKFLVAQFLLFFGDPPLSPCQPFYLADFSSSSTLTCYGVVSSAEYEISG